MSIILWDRMGDKLKMITTIGAIFSERWEGLEILLGGYKVCINDKKYQQSKYEKNRVIRLWELTNLMTERAHHWAFFHWLHKIHFFTFAINLRKFSGSLLRIWSNSANLPGRKNTLVRPNLKSLSSKPNACKWKETVSW